MGSFPSLPPSPLSLSLFSGPESNVLTPYQRFPSSVGGAFFSPPRPSVMPFLSPTSCLPLLAATTAAAAKRRQWCHCKRGKKELSPEVAMGALHRGGLPLSLSLFLSSPLFCSKKGSTAAPNTKSLPLPARSLLLNDTTPKQHPQKLLTLVRPLMRL